MSNSLVTACKKRFSYDSDGGILFVARYRHIIYALEFVLEATLGLLNVLFGPKCNDCRCRGKPLHKLLVGTLTDASIFVCDRCRGRRDESKAMEQQRREDHARRASQAAEAERERIAAAHSRIEALRNSPEAEEKRKQRAARKANLSEAERAAIEDAKQRARDRAIERDRRRLAEQQAEARRHDFVEVQQSYKDEPSIWRCRKCGKFDFATTEAECYGDGHWGYR